MVSLIGVVLALGVSGPPAPNSGVTGVAAETQSKVEHADYDSRKAKRGAWGVCALTAGDLGATEVILARGGVERDPLIRQRWARVGFGALGCLALHKAAGEEPLRARKWVIVGAVVRGLAAAWNVKVLMGKR